MDVTQKIKNIAQIKAEKELVKKTDEVYENKFTAQDTTFSAQELDKIRDNNVILAKYPTFAGFQITSLYEFFMVFVILCGVASILLFMLTPKLKSMMHGIR